jgi:hypothetical protein
MIGDLFGVSRTEVTMDGDGDVLGSVRFKCAKNGCPRVYGFQSTLDSIWKAHLALIKPLGWQRCRLLEQEDAYFFDERKVQPAQIEFLIALYSAQCKPVSAGVANSQKRRRRARNNLNQRRQRARPAFFPDYDPIVFLPDYVNSYGKQGGYLFARELEYFIVYDLVQPDPRFDWRLFLKPPGGLGLAGPQS